MKTLYTKELKSLFCSLTGIFFSVFFLGIVGALLWLFQGKYNLLDAGYAQLNVFLNLASILFIILIPALTMHSFAEEKRNKTFDILKSRPVTPYAIYSSKLGAILTLISITLLTTVVYVYSLFQLGNPVGNIDIQSIIVSYVALLVLVCVFISIGLFSSVVTKNPIIAFIVGVLLSSIAFYGFELFADTFFVGRTQAIISSMGLFHHYNLMQRGVIELNNILVLFTYIILFSFLSILILNDKLRWKETLICLISLTAINIIFAFIPTIRFDFTSDKRYTISNYSKNLLSKIGKDKLQYNIDIYLDGDLNAGFLQLQNSTKELLADFNSYSNNNLNISIKNPYQSYGSIPAMHEAMEKMNMSGIVLNEIDREGKASQKIIYPYAQVSNDVDTLVVPLLKNIRGNTALENINASIENLEFEFIDAIRLLNQKEPLNVAFIEGHGELPRAYVYDAEELLSKYYFVNRGQIESDINILNDFAAIIIAGPTEKYNEQEKYIIDQYIMSGGKVLWLIDGAYYSHQNLVSEGYSASMKNETQLDDILFTYGVRINSDLVQDKQSASIYLMAGASSSLYPCYYMPILMPSLDNPITKDIRDVKSEFISSIDLVNNLKEVLKSVLLTSSANTHLVKVPETIDFDVERIQKEPNYFDQSYIPVAISLEGEFNSAFVNRMIPDSINIGNHKTIAKSNKTKMIVASSSSIIKNEIQGQGEDTQVLPMGYDKVSQQQFGNPEFILNAINWLTDNDGWMELRSKQQQLQILNKQAVYENRTRYVALNIGLPIAIMLLIVGGFFFYRKYKYEK